MVVEKHEQSRCTHKQEAKTSRQKVKAFPLLSGLQKAPLTLGEWAEGVVYHSKLRECCHTMDWSSGLNLKEAVG